VATPATLDRDPTPKATAPPGPLGPAAVIAAVVLIAVLAGVLRLAALGSVRLDPFYDAAVRSMSLSLHNFFFGAYEPGGTVAIDKPPVDLWLQVISVKLFGFNSTALKLPQALAGTLAVPLLFDAVRRVFGALAGLAAALVLAVLPIAVLSARSDTMDAVMMLLSVLAFWLLVRYAREQSPRFLYLAAAAMGLAFNVKLLESFVALPALALLALLAVRERRWRRLAGAAAVYLAVALSWLAATLVVGGAPYAIGSTNGSAWNAAFVFNGYDRIAKPASSPDLSGTDTTTTQRRPAGQTELQRAAVPIGTPAPLRLFDHDGPLSGLRLGYVLLAALLLGAPALAVAAAAAGRKAAGGRPERATATAAAALLVWLATGVVLFSAMARLHPRYTEGFTPAVAAAAGIGLAWAIRAGGLAKRTLAAVAAVGLAIYGHYLLGGASTVWLIGAAASVVALLAAALPAPELLARKVVLAGGLGIAALLLPVTVAAGLVAHSESDAGLVGVTRPGQAQALSTYLRAHAPAGPGRYELAVGAATQAAELIVRDARRVLVLTSFDARPLVTVDRLARLVAAGSVDYALLGGGCGPRTSRKLPSCSPLAFWVRAHGVDVSAPAGLDRPKLLWRLTTH
jgi:4-amino-4-deoxy-L-arabinose transferase-like glycosyltransferase